jgi:hypothetical protein
MPVFWQGSVTPSIEWGGTLVTFSLRHPKGAGAADQPTLSSCVVQNSPTRSKIPIHVDLLLDSFEAWRELRIALHR